MWLLTENIKKQNQELIQLYSYINLKVVDSLPNIFEINSRIN